MNIEKITALHSSLMQGISIEELSDKALLRWGGILIKQYRQAKAVLRKLPPEQASQLSHWACIRELCYHDIDSVLNELENRMMSDPENFSDQILLSFADLVSQIRVAIFDESQIDAKLADETKEIQDITLIFDNDD